MIFVGDLITKGPSNREVLDFVRLNRNCRSVLGNHEHLLVQFCRDRDVSVEPMHLRTISELGDRWPLYLEWISQFPPYIDLGDFLVVHAGIRPGLPIEEQNVKDLTELRTLNGSQPGSRGGVPWFDQYYDKKTIVFGHWVVDAPLLRKNVIGIDTGCVYGGNLTAVILPERRLVSMPAVKAYAVKKGAAPQCLPA